MIVPWAVEKLIPPGANDPRIDARMGILHVAATNADSLYDYFNGPSGGVESHFYVQKDGGMEQYRDTAFEADANLYANPFALSFESQGLGDGKWTDEQIATIKRAMVFFARKDIIPLRVVTSWNDPEGGWGYHTMWGAPSKWTPSVKTCPGPKRIKQFNDILVPFIRNGGDMFDEVDAQRLKSVEADVKALKEAFNVFRRADRARDLETRKLIRDKYKLTDAQLDGILELLTTP